MNSLSDICNFSDFMSLHDYSFPNYSKQATRRLPSRRRKNEPEKAVLILSRGHLESVFVLESVTDY